MSKDKFKAGDKVVMDEAKHEGYVIRKYDEYGMYEVRVWQGLRHVGDGCVHESALTLA